MIMMTHSCKERVRFWTQSLCKKQRESLFSLYWYASELDLLYSQFVEYSSLSWLTTGWLRTFTLQQRDNDKDDDHGGDEKDVTEQDVEYVCIYISYLSPNPSTDMRNVSGHFIYLKNNAVFFLFFVSFFTLLLFCL